MPNSPFIFQRLDFTPFNPLADPDFCFYDDTLLESVKVGDLHTHEFFRLLSLCHTVMSEEKSEGENHDENLGDWKAANIQTNTPSVNFLLAIIYLLIFLCRRAGLQGPVSRWGRSSDSSSKLWLCVSLPNAWDNHHHRDGTNSHLHSARYTGFQQHTEEDVCYRCWTLLSLKTKENLFLFFYLIF